MQPKSSRFSRSLGRGRVVAEMRVAVDHGVVVKRHVPGTEQVVGEPVALLDRRGLEVGQPLALEPGHGQQASGRERVLHLGHGDVGLVAQHAAIERDVPRLAVVVELLAQALCKLLVDPLGVDRLIVAAIKREDHAELGEVRLHGALDMGILQLAGEGAAVERRRAMDLAERGGRRSLEVERLEAALPVGAQLGSHAAAHERPAHRRRLGLQLRQLRGVLLGQGLRDRREQLRDLHERAFQPAERCAQLLGMARLIDVDAEQPLAGDAGREPAHRARHLGVAPHTPAKRVLRRAVSHVADQTSWGSSAASWSIRLSTMPSPRPQKPGSLASRPNGASRSWWRNVPPASSSCR